MIKNQYFKIIVLIFIISIITSCADKKSNKKIDNNKLVKKESNVSTNKISDVTELLLKNRAQKQLVGDKLNAEVAIIDNSKTIDSIQLYLDNDLIITLQTKPYLHNFDTKLLSVGEHNIKTISFVSDKSKDTKELNFFLVSDVKPKNISYKILNTLTHDKQAYTQGFVYDNGYFYEGTGQYGESTLRKVNAKTGDLIESLNLPSDVFGEGIVLYKNQIFQLTWQSLVGYVYDRESFKLLHKFNYQTEGWGITTDGKDLIMSDGTSKIYYVEPEFFTKLRQIEVCDNNGYVNNINELEYVNGFIYANVWQTDKIIKIDPSNGKVVAVINCKKLVPKEYVRSQDNVLNGIAYNSEKNTFYVTGKRWSVIYEIELE
ncbi:MAG: glutaminyl-peptide cyclotransferase [Bacteroidales bacterium]|nr:glutaminyl-peptide cyclotransferase [Bacteroidales bacterium]